MKKRIKKKLRKGEPNNFGFWYWTIKNKDELQQFIDRGDKRQKDELRLSLQYLKLKYPDEFEVLEGNKILRELNKKENELS